MTDEMRGAQMQIRPMTEGDLDEAYAIERLCFLTPWSREAMRRDLCENELSYYVVVFLDGALAGYGGFWKIGDEGHVTNVAVHPRARRRGVGRTLMCALMREAAISGVRAMTLEVRRSNEPAQKLYRQLDFAVEGVRRNYYSDTHEDALLMWNKNIGKTLSAADEARMR